MNHVYKVIFHRGLGRAQAVPEFATSQGKVTSSRCSRKPLVSVVAAGLLFPALADAQDWNAGTEDWFNAINWSTPSSVPGGADNVYIDNGGTAQIASGQTANSADAYLGSGIGNSGSVELEGTWNANDVYLDEGTLTISNGGSMNSGLITAGGTGNSSVLVTGAGSTWTGGTFNADEIDVTVSNGGLISVGNVSGASLATTTISVTDSGSQFSAGTVSLNGGSLSVSNGGTASIAGMSAVGSSPSLTIDGGTLQLTGDNSEIFSGMTTGSVQIDAGGATIDSQAFNVGTSVGLQGTGGLIKEGTGTLTIGGANSFTGATAINAGTLAVTGGSAIADNSAVTIASGASLSLGSSEAIGTLSGAGNISLGSNTLTVNQELSEEISGSISGSGNLIKSGGSDLTLSGNNTFSGSTTINQGQINLYGGSALSDSGALIVDTGARLFVGDDETIGSLSGSGEVALDFGPFSSKLSVGADDSSTTFSGVISGPGEFEKVGSGTLTVSGTNTYTGNTIVSEGTLQADGGAAIHDASNVSIASGATLSIGASEGIGTLSGAGSVTLDANTLTVNESAATTFSGVISGTGSLIKAGADNLSLTGANTYSGGTTISAGTLTIGGGGTTGSISGDVVNNGALQFDRSDSFFDPGVISGSGSLVNNGTGNLVVVSEHTYSGGTTINSGAILIGNGGTTGSIAGNVVNNSNLTFMRSDSLAFAGDISGTGNVWIWEGGQITLSGNNSYSGSTVIGNGVLTANGGSAIGDNSAVSVGAGSTLVLDASETIGSLGGDGDVSLGANTLTSGGDNTSTTLTGVVSGTGGLIKTGMGTQTVTGANTYSGGTTISAGTLAIGNGGTEGSITGDVNNNGALQFNRSDALSITGAISGTGSVTQAGSGTTTLTGTNTYSGGTTISAGTLAIGAGGANGSISGDVTNNGTLQFNRSDAVGFAGVISGTGSVTQAGSGTTTLTGTNTYSGGTTISAGTLAIGTGGTAGSITGDVTNNGTLQFNRSDAVGFANVISGTGSVTQAGGGTTTLTGTNTYSGGTTISAGTLAIGNGGTEGSITGDVNNNGALQFNRSDAVGFAGVISGTGSLTQAGSGVLTLTGTNTYSGATTVDTGTLVINGSIANSTVNVNGGATLMGAGTIGGLNLNNGATLATGNSIDTLTVDGDVVFEAGSIFEVEVEADGSTDVLAATGTATINGGTVDVLASDVGIWSATTDYSILTADSGVTGEFDTVTSNLAFLTPTLSYDANSVQLTLTRNDISFDERARIAPEIAAAKALQRIYTQDSTALGDFFPQFLALSVDDAERALQTVNGSSLTSLSRSISQGYSALALQHMSRLTFGSQLLAQNEAEASRSNKLKQGVWIETSGMKRDSGSSYENYGAESETKAVSIGFDLTPSNNMIGGVALSRFSTDTEFDTVNDDQELDQTYLTLYLQQRRDKLRLNGLIALGSSDIKTQREIEVGSTTLTAKGDTKGSELYGYVEAAYDMGSGTLTWQPVAGLSIADIQVDEFFETGAGDLNLWVEEQKRNSVQSRLGGRLLHSPAGSRFATEFYAFWAHEFADLNNTVSVQFSEAPSTFYTVRDGDRERDALEWGASGIYNISDSATFTARFSGMESSKERWLSGSLGVQIHW